MRKVLLLILCSLCFLTGANARFPHGSVFASFTTAWQPMLLGDGGAAKGVHVFPSGDIFAFTDTSNAYLYKPSTTCAYGSSKALASPCWQPLFTSSSVDASLLLSVFASGNVGVVGLSQCQSNTSVLYAIYNNAVFVTTNKGVNWTKTNMTTDLPNPNNTQGNDYYIACDPHNPDIAYTQTQGSGLFGTTTGTAGTGWAHVAGVTSSSTNSGGSIVFDPTSTFPGNVTQHFWVSSGGIGVYETTNGGPNIGLTTSTPTTVYAMEADKFGQLWVSGGFRAPSNDVISLYSSGAWSSKLTAVSSGGGDSFLGIVFDPNTGATQANNRILAVTGNGQIIASFNNGGAWTSYVTITAASSAPQAPWLGTAWQGSPLSLNIGGVGIDASGNLWSAGGISTWTTPYPISGCPGACALAASAVWNANSVGIEQLVVNQILASLGNYPITAVWDRGVVVNPNPDAFATVQYPQITSGQTIQQAWSADYAPNKTNVIIAQVRDWPGVSLDGGNSWAAWATFPTGQSGEGMVAASTDQNWLTQPGQGGTTAANSLYFTTNGGAAWTLSTVHGTPGAFNQANVQWTGMQRVAANKGATTGFFYAVDFNFGVYTSTDGGANFNLANAGPFDGGGNSAVKIVAVPGQDGHAFMVGGVSQSGHLWQTTNFGAAWSKPNVSGSVLTRFSGFGFGAAKPGGSGYPAIYAHANVLSDDTTIGYYASFDAGVTFAPINAPSTQYNYAAGILDEPASITGDMNVYGRIYTGYGAAGSGVAYIDLADACPYVNFDPASIKPGDNAGKTGTITLTAQHSGLVPVTGVQFSVDGSNVGALQTGQSTYSVSWASSAGAHTLKVQAAGNGCTIGGTGNSFSIPVTTH